MGGASRERSTLGSVSPQAALIGQLFGLQSRVTRGGQLAFREQEPRSPGFQFFDPTQRLEGVQINPNALTTPIDLGQPFDPSVAGAGLSGALGTAAEAAQTGLIGPTQELFRQTFREQIIPDVQAQFGELGLNQTDADFQAAIAREAALGSAQIANLAADRRLAGAQAFPGIAQALPSTAGALRQAIRGQDPGVQRFESILGLAGIPQQGQVTSLGRSKGGASSAGAGGLGAIVGGLASAFCWVAAEYYGWHTSEWWDARNWIAHGWKGSAGDRFRKFYVAHGEWLASQVRRHAWLKALLRPLFEWARRSGSEMRRG